MRTASLELAHAIHLAYERGAKVSEILELIEGTLDSLPRRDAETVTPAPSSQVEALNPGEAAHRHDVTNGLPHLLLILPLLDKWRAAEIHAASVRLGLREGDEDVAERAESNALQELRVAVDRKRSLNSENFTPEEGKTSTKEKMTIKKLLLLMTVLVATAFQLNAQGIDPDPSNFYHPHPGPVGPIGSYNNPIKVYANIGELVETMGDFHLAEDDPWYEGDGFWTQPQTVGCFTFHPYVTQWGQYRGQFLYKIAEPGDYYHGKIYVACHDGVFVFFRLVHRPPANQAVSP